MPFLYINNKRVEYKTSKNLLEILRTQVEIPTLCEASHLKDFGSCRMCSVEMSPSKDGPRKVVASCHTPPVKESYIWTHSENIESMRKSILNLIIADHPLECSTCDAEGFCDLEFLSKKYYVTKSSYPSSHKKKILKDESHVYMRSHLDHCIHCFKCIRACDEVQGQFVLSMKGRGFETSIIKDKDQNFLESSCVSCGACVQVCPTQAISDKFKTKKTSQKLTSTRTICSYCGVGCNLEVFKDNDDVIHHIETPQKTEVNPGHTCLKGRYAFGFYKHPERLKSPLIKKNGKFKECSWDEAYEYITTKLNVLKKESPDMIAGISSSRCTNEENYLMQKFIRAVVGTNNIDGCARVCHAPTALGMQKTFGTGAATNSIEDLKLATCLLVVGANPTVAHPVTGAKIKQKALSGTPLIVIDPVKTELARLATVHLQLRPGTNVALLNMMLFYILKNKKEKPEFIELRTEGFKDFKINILKQNIEQLEKITDVQKHLVEKAALLYAESQRSMSFHGLGVTEHSQGTKTVTLIADLAMLTGHLGRPGVGVNPLRGQNNVQGAADMGVQPHQGAGYLDVTDPFAQKLYENHYGTPVSNQIGLKIPEMFEKALEGQLKALWIMGEDVAQTDPNTDKVVAALKKLELLVVQELFMTETAKLAHVVLPGASFLEKNGTFTNGERRVQKVNQVVPPIGDSKSDGQIMVDIMNKMGYQQPDYNAAHVFEEISQIVPFFKGMTREQLGEFGKQWPFTPEGNSTKILHTDSFKRGLGKFHFYNFEESQELDQHHNNFPFILTTVRELEHYNCGTMTRRTPNVEILKEDVLLINPKDAQRKNIADAEFVNLKSARNQVTLKVKISDSVQEGQLSSTFHFPEIMINKITSDVADKETLCPEYKVVAVDIEKT